MLCGISRPRRAPSCVDGFAEDRDKDKDKDTGHCRTCGRSPVMAPRNTQGLDSVAQCAMRPLNSHLNTPRIDSYRFSMANLEDSQETELDAILGELCALETQCDQALSANAAARRQHLQPKPAPAAVVRTDSPDNDSAFSDNVSMLSSESSASSGGSGGRVVGASGAADPGKTGQPVSPTSQMDVASRAKAEKIKIALEKMREASVKKLFIKAFGGDGSSKSLLVDESMTAGHVARLLADKNHTTMDPGWAVVEHLPELHMERAYEDHELLVENLLMWTRDSKNKLLFVERPEKVALFTGPELFLLPPGQRGCAQSDFDDHSRTLLLEEFFSGGAGVPEVEGPLFLKSESKKGWKRHHFVLRASGLYYLPKEKARGGGGGSSARDLAHLASFDVNQVYYGVGWRKKYKAPTDFCFAIKHPRLQQPKSTKYIKFLCAEDEASLHRWVVGIRLAKFGRQLMDNYRALVDELAQDDLDQLAQARSCSVSSIAPALGGGGARSGGTGGAGSPSDSPGGGGGTAADAVSTGSSSSGCLSDGCCGSAAGSGGTASTLSGNTAAAGFECDFPTTGTIKRKPSVNPKLPLTSITRQLKEVGETVACTPSTPSPSTAATTPTSVFSPSVDLADSVNVNVGTVQRAGSVRRRRSCQTPSTPDGGGGADGGSNSSTLKRHHSVGGGSARSSASASSSSSSTPVREPPPPLPVPAESEVEEELPPPPPDMFESTLSLDSLPPPAAAAAGRAVGQPAEPGLSAPAASALPPAAPGTDARAALGCLRPDRLPVADAPGAARRPSSGVLGASVPGGAEGGGCGAVRPAGVSTGEQAARVPAASDAAPGDASQPRAARRDAAEVAHCREEDLIRHPGREPGGGRHAVPAAPRLPQAAAAPPVGVDAADDAAGSAAAGPTPEGLPEGPAEGHEEEVAGRTEVQGGPVDDTARGARIPRRASPAAAASGRPAGEQCAGLGARALRGRRGRCAPPVQPLRERLPGGGRRVTRPRAARRQRPALPAVPSPPPPPAPGRGTAPDSCGLPSRSSSGLAALPSEQRGGRHRRQEEATSAAPEALGDDAADDGGPAARAGAPAAAPTAAPLALTPPKRPVELRPRPSPRPSPPPLRTHLTAGGVVPGSREVRASEGRPSLRLRSSETVTNRTSRQSSYGAVTLVFR
ncbi:ras-associated and pleckstrin homology domains-containing protein 1-like isoform X2 [Schistocerca serialis cubense]|uniref:ras-associated and pleckstrin homology domains-containing protein 1-like isoform X2 n=2 Tax=Schistocerca serialis cubense TaxID=2023355 RepID=UPI00214E069A|nr:ras-associated and pleckstrin homology domains-containing protein 1-like isoform X2 [Schistocerca serialis cubense]